MNELELRVWAAAYAARFESEYRSYECKSDFPWECVDGFACAEMADVAVDKLRQALSKHDAMYLKLR